jgi:hypothetical protein
VPSPTDRLTTFGVRLDSGDLDARAAPSVRPAWRRRRLSVSGGLDEYGIDSGPAGHEAGYREDHRTWAEAVVPQARLP